MMTCPRMTSDEDRRGARPEMVEAGRYNLATMSSLGHSTLRSLLRGSVMQRVLSSRGVPVLVLR
jgi:nucleotide-binding universal stress UspA family protein